MPAGVIYITARGLDLPGKLIDYMPNFMGINILKCWPSKSLERATPSGRFVFGSTPVVP